MDETRTGGCLCGAVVFEVTLPSKWCAHCHCSMCRRAHGAAFVTWFGVDSGQFRLTGGRDDLVRYSSSSEATRSFCRVCGSTMLFESSRWPGEVHVALASVRGQLDREPEAHVFYSDHAPWIQELGELPRRGGDSGTDPLG